MANGKRGDSPLSDMLIHGLHPFPADMETMLREVLAIQPRVAQVACNLWVYKKHSVSAEPTDNLGRVPNARADEA